MRTDAGGHLERNGLIALDGFAADAYRTLFAELETAQREFLASESAFRSARYRWPSDALHAWSRCWEYPYALHALRSLAPVPGRLLDVGPGVTFFPFALARDGWTVDGVDVDPAVVDDLRRAVGVTPSAPGVVRAVLGDGARLPFPDASFDAAASISVLEHVDDPLAALEEIARVLRPDAPFVLTLDVDLTGRAAIAPAPFDALLSACDRLFRPLYPERTVHPLRVLDLFNGPYPQPRQRQVPGLMLRARDGRLRPLVGGPIAAEPAYLACYAAAYGRR